MYYLDGGLYVGNWINKRSKTEYEFRSVYITDKIEHNKELSPEGTRIAGDESFFESINKSKENLFENIDTLNLDIVENKLHKGFRKYSRIKKPYRK